MAFVDCLQKVREFSGGFVERLWVCDGFIESLVVVLWSGSCGEGL